MRVFVTGASGHIGSAVVPELIAAGHQVTGLTRSEASAAVVSAAGATALPGTIDDLDLLRSAAADADGVIHLAFKHEAMRSGDMQGAAMADQTAVEAMLDALAGTDKAFVGTSGTLLLSMAAPGRVGTEADVASGGRADTENLTIEAAARGVRTSVVRLPPTVHSSLDHHGFIPTLIGMARANGQAAYVGDGANRWPAGHTLDAARLYRLALESAPAGSRLHAVGDEGVPFVQIAEAIGRNLGLPAVRIAAEEADKQLGFLGGFAQLDNPTSSELTRKLLGWAPIHPGLIADMDEGHYFAPAREPKRAPLPAD
ncbi:MAG TPA: SDR family oxidoreductase [Trebonia sp.]|jgi:nucleoside-diphosphate-sugar epimerase|nr:SDR family oxidoreductase [Trebonia sp.]